MLHNDGSITQLRHIRLPGSFHWRSRINYGPGHANLQPGTTLESAREDSTDVKTREVQAFFERVAADWDDIRLDYYDERVIEKLAEVSRTGADTTVADVGTGTGFVAAGLAPRVGRILAVDNSEAMLAGARENLDALGIDNVELLTGDVSGLPLESSSVDAACANMVLHHAEDPAGMVGEMARVVRPGGTVALVDAIEHPFGWMHAEHADVWLGFREEQVETFFRGAGLDAFGYESLGMQ